MKSLTSASSHLLPDAPRMAPGVGMWKKFAARWAGRCSARTTAPNADGYHPATQAMAADVARVEAHIHTALVKTVESLDQTIARSEIKIRLLAARLAEPSEAPVGDPPAAMTAVEQDVFRAREAAIRKSRRRRADTQREYNRIKAHVAELSERREHLHSTAAGILASWTAWFDALAAYHREGFIRALTRRFPAPVLTIADPGNLPLPRYKPTYAWATGGQLPVTVTDIQPDRQPTLTWAHVPWEL